MIGYIYGDILDITDRAVLVDTGNIGYFIYTTENTLNRLRNEKTASFYTYLSVREDALDLYGFETKQEKKLFELIISVSGIGPRGALGVINIAPVGTIANAIRSGDSSYMTRVSGVGKKTAEKIVLELRDKAELLLLADTGDQNIREDSDVRDALIALGYKEYNIREVLKNITIDLDVNSKIKEAIKLLGK